MLALSRRVSIATYRCVPKDSVQALRTKRIGSELQSEMFSPVYGSQCGRFDCHIKPPQYSRPGWGLGLILIRDAPDSLSAFVCRGGSGKDSQDYSKPSSIRWDLLLYYFLEESTVGNVESPMPIGFVVTRSYRETTRRSWTPRTGKPLGRGHSESLRETELVR